MRLQCPNCDAEYEVDASVIPHEGRDVQCSNCGHGWFQSHPDFEADYDVESSLYDPPPPLVQAQNAEFPKKELDPAAKQILREEVALEEAKRAAEAAKAAPAPQAASQAAPAPNASPTTSPNAAAPAFDTSFEDELDQLGMADPNFVAPSPPAAPAEGAAPEGESETGPIVDTAVDAFEAQLDADRAEGARPSGAVVPRRVARLKGLNEEAAAQTGPTSPAPQGKGQPLPPLVELDLRSDISAATPPKSGRRAGIYTALFGGIAAAAAYVLSPEISANLPQVAGPMAKYVSFVNGLRDMVQTFVPAVSDGIGSTLHGLRDWLVAQGWI